MEAAAPRVAEACGPKNGLRVLHVTDFHRRRRAFRLAHDLTVVLGPDVVVNTGDLLGLVGPLETMFLKRWASFPAPQVFAPGNHDSKNTIKQMKKLGAAVLEKPRLASAGGLTVWGYPDPNHSRFLRAPNYNSDLCRRSAITAAPLLERTGGPFIVAVHNDEMVPAEIDQCPVILSGHWHVSRIRRQGPTLSIRTGNAGGRNRFGPEIHFTVLDLDPATYQIRSINQIEVGEHAERVTPAEF